MRGKSIELLAVSAVAMCITLAPARAAAQLNHPVGVSVAVVPAESDTVGRPLIRMPGWWPDRVTHQNVASLLAVGAVGFGVIWVLPEGISKWDKSVPISYYLRRAYTRPPVWDQDPLYWNYVVHPVVGSWVYLMERNHDRRPIRGFLLSTAASIGWEYGYEAMIEQPSIQDLLITSTVGSVLGELSHKATLRMKKNGFSGLERVALTVINPAYVVWKGYR